MKLSSLLLFTAFLSLSSMAQANCLSAGVIDNKPIGYLDSQGNATGVHWEFLEEISRESGLCIEEELMPFARVWQGLEVGDHDLVVGFASPSRDKKVIKVGLIRELKTIVVGAKGFNIRYYEDLVGLEIGKTRSTKLDNRFDKDTQLNINELNDYEQAVNMLLAGRINALAGSYKAIKYQLEQSNQPNYLDRNGFHVLGVRQQWLHMSKQSEFKSEIPKLKAAVEKLQATGTLAKLVKKHYEASN